MSIKRAILVLGLLVAVLPFAGIPGSWKSFLMVLLGLSVAVLAFLAKQEEIRRGITSPRRDTGGVYVENGAPVPGPGDGHAALHERT